MKSEKQSWLSNPTNRLLLWMFGFHLLAVMTFYLLGIFVGHDGYSPFLKAADDDGVRHVAHAQYLLFTRVKDLHSVFEGNAFWPFILKDLVLIFGVGGVLFFRIFVWAVYCGFLACVLHVMRLLAPGSLFKQNLAVLFSGFALVTMLNAEASIYHDGLVFCLSFFILGVILHYRRLDKYDWHGKLMLITLALVPLFLDAGTREYEFMVFAIGFITWPLAKLSCRAFAASRYRQRNSTLIYISLIVLAFVIPYLIMKSPIGLPFSLYRGKVQALKQTTDLGLNFSKGNIFTTTPMIVLSILSCWFGPWLYQLKSPLALAGLITEIPPIIWATYTVVRKYSRLTEEMKLLLYVAGLWMFSVGVLNDNTATAARLRVPAEFIVVMIAIAISREEEIRRLFQWRKYVPRPPAPAELKPVPGGGITASEASPATAGN